MKVSLVILACCCAAAFSLTIVGKNKLEMQQKIQGLLYRMNQPSFNAEHIEIAKTHRFYDHVDSYTKPEVVKTYYQYYKYDLLPRGAIFSVANDRHMSEAIALFKLFYHSKDWDTLYKTAAWARQHVNEGMFVYALSVTVIHSPITRGVVLPPIYEIMPNYFFSTEVMQMANQEKQMHSMTGGDQHVDKYIDSNYSGWYMNMHEEQSMSYFLEDVDVNAFYYYYKLYYPSWMSSEEYGWTDEARRGEMYYYVLQQIVARFYLERLSNGFGEVPILDLESPVETPYEPSLMYPNGLEFPSRPRFANLHTYFYNYGQKTQNNAYAYSFYFVKDLIRRINDAVDSGYIINEQGKIVELYTEDGLNTLGNIIDSNKDSPNHKFYGPVVNFMRHLLGYSHQPLDHHKLVPSALEHFQTSMRDPVFFQIVKKMVLKFQRYYVHMQPYMEKDLVMSGVKVTDLEVDPLVTYHEYSHYDLSNGMWYNQNEKPGTFHVRVRQERLNHKPFTYKIHVKSDKTQKVAVKVYLGPKYDEYGRVLNLTENRLNFVELDHFVEDVKAGDNMITRNCHESTFYGPDRVSDHEMYQKVTAALEGNGQFVIDPRQSMYSFPQRFMLPKGTPEGTTYQMFVMVMPHVPYKGKQVQKSEIIRPGTGDMFLDARPLGYPFDRFIVFEKMWYQIPNMYFHDEKVYHKDIQEVNAPHH